MHTLSIKKLVAAGIATILAGAVAMGANAQTATTTVATSTEETATNTQVTALLEQIQTLLAQLQELQSQIDTLKNQQGAVRQELQETIQLTRSLSQGMSGEEVETLQEILATDPEIYPEGLTTGFFGPLTAQAVKRFQKKAGLEDDGIVGANTRSRINELLTVGAGNSGMVPPGLLIAPGIKKILGEAPAIPEGQRLPPGIAKKLGLVTGTPDDESDEDDGDSNGDADGDDDNGNNGGTDVTPPQISGVTATGTLATSTRITWATDEPATSKVFYATATPVNLQATTTPSVSNATLVTAHDIALEGLTASTTYYVVAESADASGNTATSSETSFTTAN